ncbi:PREDICTED: protein panoramix [Drosophila arizonae]|uniref:Protein panoramix n=1 Tax=Drosophila arizonae TaxID=7263 RepID=A0ABM1PR94_DROAR|nr:PREDICTED: protein panoramix [Drosophila arizonae]
MEAAARVKTEVESTYSNIIYKQSPTENEDNACTPLRDEGGQSPLGQEAINANGATGWESDADDQASAPPPPSMFVKRSPQNDYCPTPLRVVTTFEPEPAETQRESEENGNSDLPIDDNEDSKELIVVKKEERRELQLGFLDILSETDFQGVVDESFSHVDQLDQMDLEPPNANNEEEQALQDRIEERQRELERLERTEEEKEKKRKKHKKEKKNDSHKKRRRSRSRSGSNSPSSHKSRKERRLQEPDRPSGSRMGSKSVIKTEPDQLDYVPVRPEEKSIKVINISKLQQKAPEAPPAPLTVQEKRRRGVERAKKVLELMQLKASKAPETEFLVVNTIRKLPKLGGYMSSHTFENPSPLCNNFNVRYKFNSTSVSNINLKKWGLEPLPNATRELLRLTGINVTRLMELQQNSKMTIQQLRFSHQKENGNCSKTEDESLSTGLYKSASTQTDPRMMNLGRNVGVQAVPPSHEGVYWLNSRFNDSDLTQQQTNVLLALKELTASPPSSSLWADRIFRELRNALAIKRVEAQQLKQ